MKFWLSTLLLILLAFLVGRATGGNIAHPGMSPYTPTRLEWLETQCWIAVREDTIDVTSGSGMTIDTVGRAPETIVLTVRYMPNMQRDAMNVVIERKKQLIRAVAQGYHWDSWLKIEEDVAPMMSDK